MVNGNNTRRPRRRIISNQIPEEDVFKDPSPLIVPILGSAIIFVVLLATSLATAIFFAFCATAYIAFCIFIAGKISFEEQAFIINGATPDENKYYSGGYYFIWVPYQRFNKIQIEPFQIDIPKQHIISAAKGSYSSAVPELNTYFYFRPPRTTKGLIDFRRNTPTDKELFNAFFINHVLSCVRSISGKFTWHEIAIDSPAYTAALHDEILHGGIDNVVQKAAIEELSITNQEVALPEELKKSISMPQIAVYKKTATEIEAEGEKYRLTKVGEGDAAAIKSKGTQEVAIKKTRLAAMAKHPEMAQIDVYREATERAGTLIMSLNAGDRDALGQIGTVDDMIKKVSLPVLAQFVGMSEDQQMEVLKKIADNQSQQKKKNSNKQQIK